MNHFLDAVFAPIARLCVVQGVLFPQLVERFKAQFVRAAIGAINSKPTDSRISVMTGLQRRDIARLRANESEPNLPINHLARLVARWVAAGAATLSRHDFDVLASEIRRDVHPATQLAQLVDAGTVAVAGDGLISLLSRSYQPSTGSTEQLEYLARNGGDFLKAGIGNIITDPAPFYERAVHYNGMSAEAVGTLEEEFRADQQVLLEQINARAATLRKSAPGNHRFRAGGYFYQENEN